MLSLDSNTTFAVIFHSNSMLLHKGKDKNQFVPQYETWLLTTLSCTVQRMQAFLHLWCTWAFQIPVVVVRVPEDHPVPTPLPCERTPSTRPGGSNTHSTWMLTEKKHLPLKKQLFPLTHHSHWKISSLISNLNPPSFNLKPFTPVQPLQVLVKSPSSALL